MDVQAANGGAAALVALLLPTSSPSSWGALTEPDRHCRRTSRYHHEEGRRPHPGRGEVVNGWADRQPHSPDGHAIVGRTDVDGSLTACAASGHGVQQSPLLGVAVSELIADGAAMTVDRFDEPDPIEPEELA